MGSLVRGNGPPCPLGLAALHGFPPGGVFRPGRPWPGTMGFHSKVRAWVVGLCFHSLRPSCGGAWGSVRRSWGNVEGLGLARPSAGFGQMEPPAPGPSLLRPGPGAGGWIYWKWGFSVLPGNLGRPMLIWAGNGLVLGWDDGFRFGVRRVARDSVLPHPPRPLRGGHRAGLFCPWGLWAGATALFTMTTALPGMRPRRVTLTFLDCLPTRLEQEGPFPGFPLC